MLEGFDEGFWLLLGLFVGSKVGFPDGLLDGYNDGIDEGFSLRFLLMLGFIDGFEDDIWDTSTLWVLGGALHFPKLGEDYLFWNPSLMEDGERWRDAGSGPLWLRAQNVT